MAKQYKDKVAALKAIASGKETVDVLRPPQHFVVLKRTDEDGILTYEQGRIVMNEEQYTKWYKANVREDQDTILYFVEVLYRREDGEILFNGNEQIKNDEVHSSRLEIHQEPIEPQQKQKDNHRHTVSDKKEDAANEPVIAPQLRPYSEHIRFNEYMAKKLFL